MVNNHRLVKELLAMPAVVLDSDIAVKQTTIR